MTKSNHRLQIDRIDNDKGYFKENCHWVTSKQNCSNRKKNNCKSKLESKLDKFQARPYQLPLCDALENKKIKRLLVIWPRRAGKDICAFNLVIRAALKKIGVYYYIFPTYSQARKVIWDSLLQQAKSF